MPAGEPTWATVTVKNVGVGDVTWFHDGCAIAIGISGAVPGTWRQGIAQRGQAASFKQRLLERMPDDISISFAPESMIRVGRIGCADIGMSDTIRAGRSIKQRTQWDGMAYLRLGLPPTGPITIDGWAGYYFRGKNSPSNLIEKGLTKFHGDGWISNGKDPSWLDPPEVIDAALMDPALVAWLEDQRLGNGVSEILWFDLKRSLWQVGTLEYGPDRLHYDLVDPATGEIRGTVERHWDPDKDGYP